MPVTHLLPTTVAVMAGLVACDCRERVSPDSAPSETGPAGDTGELPRIERICNDDYLDPATLPEPIASPSQPDQVYRVVRVPSETFDEAYMLVLFHADPEQRLYDAGAPVVVSAIPSLLTQEAPAFQIHAGFGAIEVQPILSGWSIAGLGSSGEPDAGGQADAALLREAILFAAGRKTTVEGYTLGQVVQAPVCNDKVVVLGSSSGGAVAMQALDGMDLELSEAVMGLANHEAPVLPQLITSDIGALWMDPGDSTNALDEDGSGFSYDEGLNPAYQPGDCRGDSCDLDYSALAWDPLVNPALFYPAQLVQNLWPGVLYLDLDGDQRLSHIAGSLDVDQNGALDPDEDFVFPPLWDRRLPGAKHRYSAELLEAAVTAGVLDEGDWPEHVAPLAESQEHWQRRNMALHNEGVAQAAPPWFRVAVEYTLMDHGVAAPDRPHITLFYDAMHSLGVPVRYNGSEAMMECAIDRALWQEGWAGAELPYDHPLEPSELDAHALPETIPNSLVKAVPVLTLFWDLYGPFDRCPELANESPGSRGR